MAYLSGEIARNTYDKDVAFYNVKAGVVHTTLYGLGVSLKDGKVDLLASGDTFIGVALRGSGRNCGEYYTSTDAWSVDVINDGYVTLNVTGSNIKVGDLVTVGVGGVFAKTTDVALSIGKVTSVGNSIFEVELTGNMITVAGAPPLAESKTIKRGEVA